MPQMSPLLWLSLYAFFTATFLGVIVMIFFLKLPPKISSSISYKPSLPLSWKW